MPIARTKQPSEERTYQFNFTNKLVDGRTLSSCAPIVQSVRYAPEGVVAANLTISGVVVSTPKAQCKISGGTNGCHYSLKALGTDSAGDVIEVDGILKIKEVT